MISYIKCKVKLVEAQQLFVVLDSGEIGFSVGVSQPSNFQQDQDVELHTYLHWNQEQGPSLYGFQTIEERGLFVLIIGCSGIGPKMALSMLSQISIGEFICAVQTHDVKRLSQLKGIGAKKAEQVVLQLRDKVDIFAASQKVESVGVAKHLTQVSEVLQSLNYSRIEIQQTLSYLRDKTESSEPAFDQVMRQALSFLSKKV